MQAHKAIAPRQPSRMENGTQHGPVQPDWPADKPMRDTATAHTLPLLAPRHSNMIKSRQSTDRTPPPPTAWPQAADRILKWVSSILLLSCQTNSLIGLSIVHQDQARHREQSAADKPCAACRPLHSDAQWSCLSHQYGPKCHPFGIANQADSSKMTRSPSSIRKRHGRFACQKCSSPGMS